MDRIAGRHLASLWFLPMLVVLLVVGHLCDLTAYAGTPVSSHAAESSHHSADGHGGEQLASSCDAVNATSSPGYSHHLYTGAELSVGLTAIKSTPARSAPRSFEDPARLRIRPPLFLLHASLLI